MLLGRGACQPDVVSLHHRLGRGAARPAERGGCAGLLDALADAVLAGGGGGERGDGGGFGHRSCAFAPPRIRYVPYHNAMPESYQDAASRKQPNGNLGDTRRPARAPAERRRAPGDPGGSPSAAHRPRATRASAWSMSRRCGRGQGDHLPSLAVQGGAGARPADGPCDAPPRHPRAGGHPCGAGGRRGQRDPGHHGDPLRAGHPGAAVADRREPRAGRSFRATIVQARRDEVARVMARGSRAVTCGRTRTWTSRRSCSWGPSTSGSCSAGSSSRRWGRGSCPRCWPGSRRPPGRRLGLET